MGHPDISGDYTNKDEANTPLERPDNSRGAIPRSFTQAELDELVKRRQTQAAAIAGGIGGAETGAGPTHWYEHLRGTGNRPWLITDPADGKLPPMTPQALKHEAAVAALNDARNGEGRADSWLDRSTYDRCITRGLPGSMMPAIYGNAYQIMQTPDSVVVRYEMIHETRVIPLDGRPHVSKAIRGYLGDARVLGGQHARRRDHQLHQPHPLRLQQPLQQRVADAHRALHADCAWPLAVGGHVQRPEVWTRPFTFAMPLTRDDTQQIFDTPATRGTSASSTSSPPRAPRRSGEAAASRALLTRFTPARLVEAELPDLDRLGGLRAQPGVAFR